MTFMQASDLKNLNVAIIGAGYAGAAAGKAFSRLGCNVTVYEQASQIREVGAGIGLRPSTMDRFRAWGIADAIEKVSSPSDYMQILDATGNPIMQEPWPEIDTFGFTTHLIHRGDFIDALLGVLPPDMVHLGHSAQSIEDQGDHATVTFTNGHAITADLVVAADGIKSTIREQLFSDQQPVFSGEHAYRTVISLDASHGMILDDNFRMYIGRGTKVYLLPLRHRDQVSFDVTSLCPDPTWAPVVTKADVLEKVEGFDERIISMARDLDMSTVSARAVYDIDPVENWHTDSVVLVGDAAHAMLHHQGQGANSAIMDVGALVNALSEAGSVKEALVQFQTTRKPITDELQRISRQGWSEDEVNDVFPGQKPVTMGTGN
jgi:salicylate hydroxylase